MEPLNAEKDHGRWRQLPRTQRGRLNRSDRFTWEEKRRAGTFAYRHPAAISPFFWRRNQCVEKQRERERERKHRIGMHELGARWARSVSRALIGSPSRVTSFPTNQGVSGVDRSHQLVVRESGGGGETSFFNPFSRDWVVFLMTLLSTNLRLVSTPESLIASIFQKDSFIHRLP